MPEELVVRQCAPTLAGLKTGSLFRAACTDKKALLAQIRDLNQRLREKGLCLIENHAQNYKLSGLWKVYGDEAYARAAFAKYKKCTDIYCRSWRSGASLEALTVAS